MADASRCTSHPDAFRTLIANGNGIDRAFVDEMIPHHVAAVDMAKLALSQGQSEFIRGLAASIISSQNVEIATMRKISAKLKARGIKTVDMGLTEAQKGMDHDMSHLIGASPFDVVFVDMMIPHHEGAVTMSKVVLSKGVGAETRALARQITSAQTQEIQIMRSFRIQTAGTPTPGADEHPH